MGFLNFWQSAVEPSFNMQNMQTDIANQGFVAFRVCALLNSYEKEAKTLRILICNSKDLNECMTRKFDDGKSAVIDSQ